MRSEIYQAEDPLWNPCPFLILFYYQELWKKFPYPLSGGTCVYHIPKIKSNILFDHPNISGYSEPELLLFIF